jgi:hypothetical protein
MKLAFQGMHFSAPNCSKIHVRVSRILKISRGWHPRTPVQRGGGEGRAGKGRVGKGRAGEGRQGRGGEDVSPVAYLGGGGEVRGGEHPPQLWTFDFFYYDVHQARSQKFPSEGAKSTPGGKKFDLIILARSVRSLAFTHYNTQPFLSCVLHFLTRVSIFKSY